MTIEYDVREDLPADTDAFYLEPASEDLISHLIAGRFPHLSQVDAQRIAHFSCGNARIAIALARTVERGQTVCGFQDDELFRRLFVQRNDPSDSLLSSAEVLSLVYSFNGDDTTSAGSELRFLASLAGRDPLELHRHTADLRDRDLVQKRGVWRAVLPHALANRLARRALQRLPRDRVMDGFLEGGSDRLIRSFSRRLSFLHDCEEASLIAEQWLSEGGWLTRRLEDDHNFNDFAIAVLRSLAPLSPDKALSAIARAPRSKPEGNIRLPSDPAQ